MRWLWVLLLSTLSFGQLTVTTAPGGGSGASITGTNTVVNTQAGTQIQPLQVSTSCPLPQGQVNVPYTLNLNAQGGTPGYTWTQPSGTLPTGLSLSTLGLISGTPSVANPFSFTLQVTDSATPPLTTSVNCSMTVTAGQPPTLSVLTTTFPSGFVNSFYSQVANAQGGTPPYSWIIVTGGLPTGLSLVPNGTISGTPTTQQNNTFTLQVTDSSTPTQTALSQSLGITINPAPPPPPSGVSLPFDWVDGNECIPPGNTYDDNFTIKSNGTGTYPYSCAGLQSSMDTWAGATDRWTHVAIDPGLVCRGGSQSAQALFSLRAKLGATKCIVYESSNPPTRGQTLCSHGTTDSFSRNPGCTNDISKLWTVEDTASLNGAVVSTDDHLDSGGNGVSYILIRDGEFRPQAGISYGPSIVVLGDFDPQTTTVASTPSHVHFQYSYVHGDVPDSGPTTSTNIVVNAFKFNCRNCSLEYNYTDQIIRPGAEGHQVAITNSPGPCKIVGNWFEGASSGLFTGGAVPSIPGIVSSTDCEVRRNRFTYNPAWLGLAPSVGSMVRKNATEFKEGNRILLDGNIFENVDDTGAQKGPIFAVQVRSCSGGVPCDNYQSNTTNLTITNNIFRHSCSGTTSDGRSGGTSGGLGTSFGENLILWNNNLDYDAALANPGCSTASPTTGMRFGSSGTGWTGCTGSRASSGVDTIDCSASASKGLGFNQHDMSTGDIAQVTNCADAAFNTATNQIGQVITFADPATLVVQYKDLAGLTSVASTTGCTLNNHQGWPKAITITHTTWMQTPSAGNSVTFNPANGQGQNFSFSQFHVLKNDIFISGSGWGSSGAGLGEGTPTQTKQWDGGTLTAGTLIFPGRNLNLYTEFPGPGKASFSPPTSFFAPALTCPTSTPDATCLGMVGQMSTSTFNYNLADYHGYRLCTTADAACNHVASVYSSSGIHPADDGQDIGVLIPLIDSALALTRYVCNPSSLCGTPGVHAHVPIASLSWAASTSTGIVSYNVKRSLTSGGPYSTIASVPSTSLTFDDTNVAGNTTYFYVVTAVNSAGTESANSNQVTAAIPNIVPGGPFLD